MLCCGEPLQEVDAIHILQTTPDPCLRHQKQIRFVCKSCPHESLLCQSCITDHQNHDWTQLSNYQNQDVLRLFQSGCSRSGKAVSDFVDFVVNLLVQYQRKIQDKIKFVIVDVVSNLEKLKAKFPEHGVFRVSGTKIDQKNIQEIDRILSFEKYIFDTRRLEKTFKDIISTSQTSIFDNLDMVRSSLSDKDWDLVEESDVLKIETDYISIFQRVLPDRKFIFSSGLKNSGISLQNSSLTAVYTRQIPRSPVVLLNRSFQEDLHTVGFKITKMPTNAIFFDKSRIYIGVCNQSLAQKFGFLDFAKPSKGAYLISSTGKSYHSKLPEYHDTTLAFSFRGGDIVTIDLNIGNGVLIFQKKTGKIPFWKRLAMPLGLQAKYIRELRPCVMFEGESGAMVTILNETELQLEIDGQQVYPLLKE